MKISVVEEICINVTDNKLQYKDINKYKQDNKAEGNCEKVTFRNNEQSFLSFVS